MLETLTLAERRSGVPPEVARTFRALEAQVRTLQKRLRTLDPLSTRGRQTKEEFDMVEWVRDTLETHDAQFRRHGIKFRFETVPKRNAEWRLLGVKGMVLQVIENMVSNSVYWLKQRHKRDRDFCPELVVLVNVTTLQIRFSDNGPGIEPERRELVFRAFHSTKAPGAGNGLGLYIAREIAQYHHAAVYLDDAVNSEGKLHTFVFDFSPTREQLRTSSDFSLDDDEDDEDDHD